MLNAAVWEICLNTDLKSEAIRQLREILPFEPIFSNKPSYGLPIIIGTPDSSLKIEKAVLNDLISLDGFGPDDHLVKSIMLDGVKTIIIAGITPKAALYGIFSFLEELGFYFLASRFIVPEPTTGIEIPELDKSYTSKNKWRGMFVSFCMVSTSIMSLSDFRMLFDNMLRMRLNRIIFYPFENEPIVDYTYKGERKLVGDISRPESGYFSYGRNWTGSFNVNEIAVGKEKFAPRKRIAPMEFQDVNSSEEALDRGKSFMNEIVREAAARQIGVWIAFLPQFVSMNMAKFLKPMPRKNLHWSALVSCTDSAAKEINSARIKNIIDSYPGLEGLFVGIPEGFYEDPYEESREYIDSQMPGFKIALELQKNYWGDHWPGDELQKKHMEADIAFSKTAIEALDKAREYKPDIKLGLITVCKAYLLTKLHQTIPNEVAFCDIESRSLWTHGGAPLFLFRDMKGRECSIIPRITDDGSQAGMQFNLGLYYKDGYCRSAKENGTAGLMMQTLHIKGADHNIKYLADGLWNTDINPYSFYSVYFKKVYGDAVSGDIRKAYEVLEDNEEFMGGRGAANMPWNHVPPEIAVMRNLQKAINPFHECPLDWQFIENSKKRADIYRKTIVALDIAKKIFETAVEKCTGSSADECRYMGIRTNAYKSHLEALVMISEIYSSYSDAFKCGNVRQNLTEIVLKIKKAGTRARKSAELFSGCIAHVTDLAPLWMLNSSMVKGTEILLQFMSNILAFHEGREYWNPIKWNELFGECPYPAHGIDIKSSEDISTHEPG